MKFLCKFLRINSQRVLFLMLACCSIGISDFIFADSLNQNIQMDNLGNSVSVWINTDNFSFYNVQGSSASFNGTWSSPVTISDVNLVAQNPVLSMNAGGDCVVLWAAVDPNSGNLAVFASTRPSTTGVWSTGVMISNGQNTSNDHKIRINSDGKVIASWTEYFDSSQMSRVVYVATQDIFSGSWSSPTQVSLQ